MDDARVPSPSRAKAEYVRAMESWDAEAADAAIVASGRSSGAAGTMESIWRYAVRDQWYIGHKAIFAAQSWRTLQSIGWQHAEPVLRSLVFGLLDVQNDSRHVAVGPYEANLENARKVRDGWQVGTPDAAATRSLLQTIRQANAEGAAAEALALLNRGVAAESLWDAVVLAAAELMIRAPGTCRCMRTPPPTRFTPFSRQRRRHDAQARPVAGRGLASPLPGPGRIAGRAGHRCDGTDASPSPRATRPWARSSTPSSIDRAQAAKKALGYLVKGGSTERVFAAARRLIVRKCRDAHDFKYGVAAWEECSLTCDPRWRAPLAAATMFKLPGASPRTARS